MRSKRPDDDMDFIEWSCKHYQDKKNKLKQMADTGVSNISVKQIDVQGNESTSDDYEIQGIEDLDDTGKPSNAIIKNKNTGEMKTVDPHIIDIKS